MRRGWAQHCMRHFLRHKSQHFSN